MTPPDPESLRVLVLVGDLHSIGAAAEELGVSQPSASKRLGNLEHQLGVGLVERSGTGCTLTPAGRRVAEWSRQVLVHVDVLMTGARGLRAGGESSLQVAASTTVAEYLAPTWISRLRGAMTNLQLALEIGDSTQVGEFVKQERVELGFVESPVPPQDLSACYVTREQMAIVVSPEHPWARRRHPVSPEELAATPLITRAPGSGTREALDRALAARGVASVTPLQELRSTSAMRTAVVAGAGPAVLSTRAVASDVRGRLLVEVPLADLELGRPIHAIWSPDRPLSGRVLALLAIATRSRTDVE